jgi:hypothetical protein
MFSAIVLQIQPYVNGTLYSLLSNSKIAASARELDISEKLKVAITESDVGGPSCDEETRRQISFVLQQYEESSSSTFSSEVSSVTDSSSLSLSDDGYEEEDDESNVSFFSVKTMLFLTISQRSWDVVLRLTFFPNNYPPTLPSPSLNFEVFF